MREIDGDLSGGLPRARRPRRAAPRRAAGIEWIASPNYSAGRSAPPRLITDHWIVGTLEVAVATFQNPQRQASSTYVVGGDGRIVQMVSETDTPWTNGNLSHSVAITIEHEGGPDTPMTDAMYAASAWLHHDISARWQIPLVHTGPQASPWATSGVIRHRETGAATACCGTLDIARLMAGGEHMITREEFDAWRALLQKQLDETYTTKEDHVFHGHHGAVDPRRRARRRAGIVVPELPRIKPKRTSLARVRAGHGKG